MDNQTNKATQARVSKADAFALLVVEELKGIEALNGYTFKSLNDRCLALNYLGFTTAKGGKWTKTQMSRVLSRAEKL